MHWYLQVLSKYATFDGRARRKEYWMFQLINLIIAAVLVMLDFGTGMRSMGANLLIGAYTLATFIPSLAVTVRRLHDINRSGWWLLIGLIPLGGLVLLIFMCLDSNPGPNQYGPNPKQEGYGSQGAMAAAAPYGAPGVPAMAQAAAAGTLAPPITQGPQGFCTKCGAVLIAGNRFCTSCGSVAG